MRTGKDFEASTDDIGPGLFVTDPGLFLTSVLTGSDPNNTDKHTTDTRENLLSHSHDSSTAGTTTSDV